MSSFKERINQLWEEAKDQDHTLSQEEFAKEFKATRSQLRGWLSGAGEPDTEMLKFIAHKSRVSVDWLIGHTNIRNYDLKKGSPIYKAVLAEIKKEAGVSSIRELNIYDQTQISTETINKLLAITEQIKKEITKN